MVATVVRLSGSRANVVVKTAALQCFPIALINIPLSDL